MDPSKQLGKLREQVDRENFSRRRYPRKWGELATEEENKFYNPDYCNKRLEAMTSAEGTEDTTAYTGHGKSFFVSKDMHNSLLAKCRCGRPRTEGHLIKCLQKVKDKYLEDDIDNHLINKSDSPIVADRCSRQGQSNGKLPQTSNATIGWPRSRYAQWEKSTRYISPRYDMPGYKIDDHPYSHIFIG